MSRAEESRKSGRWLEAARYLMRATGRAGGDTKVRERLSRLGREVYPHLSTAEAACLGAWYGTAPDLQLSYVRALMASNRAAEARAEALALLAHGSDEGSVKQVLEVLRRIPWNGALDAAPGLSRSVFHVALLAPQSGDYEAFGRSMTAGFEIALREYNASHALPMLYRPYDTGGEGARAAIHAAEAPGAGVLVGDVLTVPTLVLAGIAQERRIPLLSPSATDPMVGSASSYVFQTSASSPEQATALARYSTREKHFTAVAVPANLDSSFRAAFEAEAVRGGATVITLGSATGLRDMRAIAADLRKQKANALLLPSEPVLAELWVAGLGREKMLLPMLATEAIDPQGFRADTRASLENMVVVGADYALAPAVFARVDSLARAGYGLEADRFVRRGYLTGRVIAQAIAGGADSPATLTAALWRRSGALGFVHYEESEATLPILSVRRGQLVRVK